MNISTCIENSMTLASFFYKKIRDSLLIPNRMLAFRIDKGQTFLTNPSISLQGLALYLTGKYGVESELYFQQIFASLIKPGDVVVDVGAHFGFYTLIAAKRVGRFGIVLSFEPSSFNFRVLRKNLRINKHLSDDVKLFNLALGDRNGEAYLGIPEGGKSGQNTMVANRGLKNLEIVKVRRFDHILKEENIKPPNVVKIDVEGAELLVLKGFGALLSKVGCVQCEIHPKMMKYDGRSPYDILEVLRASNFLIYVIGEGGNLVLEDNYRIKTQERCHIVAVQRGTKIKDSLSKGEYTIDLQYDAKGLSMRRNIASIVENLFRQIDAVKELKKK